MIVNFSNIFISRSRPIFRPQKCFWYVCNTCYLMWATLRKYVTSLLRTHQQNIWTSPKKCKFKSTKKRLQNLPSGSSPTRFAFSILKRAPQMYKLTLKDLFCTSYSSRSSLTSRSEIVPIFSIFLHRFDGGSLPKRLKWFWDDKIHNIFCITPVMY